MVRKSLSHLACTILLDRAEVSLTDATTTVKAHQRKGVWKVLAKAKAKRRLNQLFLPKDQSRVFIHVSKNPASSHWIQSGAFMSFAKYRFAIRVHSYYKFGGKKSKPIYTDDLLS